MNYDLTNPKSPKMPKLGKGLECIKLLDAQISVNMKESIVPMLFPALGAYISGTKFQYADLVWKEPDGKMTNLMTENGGNKG